LSLTEKNLARLKLEVDKLTDFYDVLRLYQFPIENTLVITALEGKKWKRSVLKPRRFHARRPANPHQPDRPRSA